MTQSQPRDEQFRRKAAIDLTIPVSARVYDYLLGGKDNYEIDRQVAEQAYAAYPGGMQGVRQHALAQRSYLIRTVGYLVNEQGTRQFLDIGTGIPTENNTHEVAQRIAPESRIVYVDNDQMVLAHARALLTSTPEGATKYIDADIREPDVIIESAKDMLDLSKPVGISLLGILHFLSDEQVEYTVRRLTEAVPSGSHLVIAQLASDVLPEMVTACESMSKNLPDPVVPRTRDEIAGIFQGLELVDPGVVQVHRWRPRPGVDIPFDEEVPVTVAVGRKP